MLMHLVRFLQGLFTVPGVAVQPDLVWQSLLQFVQMKQEVFYHFQGEVIDTDILCTDAGSFQTDCESEIPCRHE